MSLKVGIVGLPNVGKSTLFNALLKKQLALAANYPFATIEPNVGAVSVPDMRLEKLAQMVNESEGVYPPIVNALLEVVDIAGIVKGASKGEGLGNKFLSHIREVDLIALVVRDFEDADVVNTGQGMADDYQTILSELIFKDLETVEKKLEAKKQLSENKELKPVLEKLLAGFNQGKRAKEILNGEEKTIVRDLWLLTNKPQIVVVNTGEAKLNESESLRVSSAEKLGIKAEDIVVVSAKIESELASLNIEDAALFMQDLGIKESGLERLAMTAYQRLGLISFLTAGVKEVRAWTIKSGTKAPQAAGVIHTDFEKKFIKAEVIDLEILLELRSLKKAKELGKLRLEGKDYVVKDGDVVEFKVGS